MRKIKFFDTTLRDGEQSAGVNLNLQEKLEIARQLERLRVDIIEAGFPASSKGDFEAVKQIAETVRTCSVTGLSRSVRSDIDAAWEALKGGAEPRLHLFIATSPIHMVHKLRMTPEQVIEAAVEAVKYAKRFFPIVQWSAEDACRSELPFLAKIVAEVIKAGASVINIPDTVGYITPKEYGEIFLYLQNNVPNIENVSLSAHCHDDLGMAVVNSLSAIEHGATQVECTINGIGERAGNAALEEIAVALHIRKDYYQVETRLNLQEIKRTSNLVSKLTGVVVPPNKAVVGKNAFAHESGIHQDGVLKEKTTYEIISPELVGVPSNSMVLGKHSGRHAIKHRAAEYGIELKGEQLDEVYAAFKKVADAQKIVTDDQLLRIIGESTDRHEDPYTLVDLQVLSGTQRARIASVTIREGGTGKERTCSAMGAGPIEAVINCIKQVIPAAAEFEDLELHSLSSGEDAHGEAVVTVLHGGRRYRGTAIHKDIILAVAQAFVGACNQAVIRTGIRDSEAEEQTG